MMLYCTQAAVNVHKDNKIQKNILQYIFKHETHTF